MYHVGYMYQEGYSVFGIEYKWLVDWDDGRLVMEDRNRRKSFNFPFEELEEGMFKNYEKDGWHDKWSHRQLKNVEIKPRFPANFFMGPY